MPTCQIKWVDDTGQPTPDTNTAIGRVRMLARVEQHHGRGISFPASDWYFICQCHRERLSDPGMHHWQFEALVIED